MQIEICATYCAKKEEARCNLLIIAGLLFLFVVWEGIEPPTQGFSVPCSTN